MTRAIVSFPGKTRIRRKDVKGFANIHRHPSLYASNYSIPDRYRFYSRCISNNCTISISTRPEIGTRHGRDKMHREKAF